MNLWTVHLGCICHRHEVLHLCFATRLATHILSQLIKFVGNRHQTNNEAILRRKETLSLFFQNQ